MFEKIASASVRYARLLYGRWRAECDAFLVSRTEAFGMWEFRLLLAVNASFLLAVPFELIGGWYGTYDTIATGIFFTAFCLQWCWLMGLGFVTVGNVLFDNIPFVSDACQIIDGTDGLGLDKSRRIKMILEKKERAEERIGGFLTGALLYLTITLFKKSKTMFKKGLWWMVRSFFGFMGNVLIFRWTPVLGEYIGSYFLYGFLFSASAMVFFIPIYCIVILGVFGFLTRLRPSVARFPILVAAAVYVLAVATVGWCIPHSTPLTISQGILFPLLLVGYTYFFIDPEDIRTMKEIFGYIARGDTSMA